MLLLYMLIICQIQAIPQYPLNIYDSNNHLDGYCLQYYERYEYLSRGIFYLGIYSEQMMLYCLRPAGDDNSSVISNLQYTTNLNITFAQLRHKNITSEMLLSWSASIDMAERYQIFLSNYSIFSSENEVVFHNCTPPWFGSFCRFTTDYLLNVSFKDFVHSVFRSKAAVRRDPKVTCYIHLPCRTSLSCLDWREICDGKQDCLDGGDEKNCWELEMNECDDDEYRCSNGQCIPWEYHSDDSETTECLDQTDELPFPAFENAFCYTRDSPRFECEENTCQQGKKEFPCGDGDCIDEMSICANNRHRGGKS